MASLLDGIKNVIVNILDPNHQQNSGELSALRQMYDNRGDGNVRPNQWYRLHSSSGQCVGFSFVCLCSKEFQLLGAFEAFRDYECRVCGLKFDLAKFAGIKKADGSTLPPDQWESLLAKLPIRPRLTGRPESPRYLDTWDMGWNGEAGYQAYDPADKNGGWV